MHELLQPTDCMKCWPCNTQQTCKRWHASRGIELIMTALKTTLQIECAKKGRQPRDPLTLLRRPT